MMKESRRLCNSAKRLSDYLENLIIHDHRSATTFKAIRTQIMKAISYVFVTKFTDLTDNELKDIIPA